MTHPTIRAIVGAAMPETIDPRRTALLVIDFQREYFNGRMLIPNGAQALANAKRLVAWADEKRMPVYHVQHVTPPGAPIFAENGETVDFHPDILPGASHKLVQKSSVSVFPATDIDKQLRADDITTLIICGLMTHACVSGAARDAVPLGYDVIVAADACATRDITGPDGRTVSHEVLHESSLATLADTFADVLNTDKILVLPLS